MKFEPPRRQLTSLLILGALGAALAIAASDCSRSETAPTQPPPAPPPPPPPPPPVVTMTINPNALQFTDTVGKPNPGPLTVAVASADSNALTGLGIDTIKYGTGATGWLSAALDKTTAPATLTMTVKDSGMAAG